MYAKKFIKTMTFALAALFFILMGGMASLAGAFSVDVDNLTYTDTSGPREINYDFSSGDYGIEPIPANTIGLPAEAILQKNAVDLGFAFGVVPEVGSATLSAPSNSVGVATFATSAEGAAILWGSSSATPPSPSNSWTFSLSFKNFSGVTDAARRYRFEIGAAVPPPANAGFQPRFGGEWDSSGNLSLQAAVEDDDTGAILFKSEVVALSGLPPTATSIELKIDNNTTEEGKVIFSYRLDGGTTWTSVGTYTIASDVVFNSLPARFPYLYIREGAPESPFGVESQHWPSQSFAGGAYNAWLTVDDPGQANYSAVSVNSPGYLPETSMIFNSAAGHWEIPAQVFADNFDNNTIDTANWTTSGNSVAESEGVLKVAQDTENAGGKVLSRAFQINPYAPIVVQRKAKVHYANEYFDGSFALFFDDHIDFSMLDETQMSVFASHAHYNYTTTGEQPADGFYLGRYSAHFTNPTAKTSSTPWDVWFDEKIVYDPVSGVAELYINGVPEATINVGALPSGATYMKLYIDAWGWYTGHSNDSDDLSVSQKYTGTPVDLSNDVPPAAGSVVFNFTATNMAGGTEVVSQPVTGYVEQFATITEPSGSVSTNPVFSWTGISNASSYVVEVNDENWNRVWSSWDIPPGTTSVSYNSDGKAPALVNGKTYIFNIVSRIETDGQENSSFAEGSFTYTGTGGGGTISFSGLLYDSTNSAPIGSATVEMAGNSSISTTTDTTGAFVLDGLPADELFSVRMSPPPALTGLVPTYTQALQSTTPITAARTYNLFAASDLTTWGTNAGTGVIRGRVMNSANLGAGYVSGAVVSYVSSLGNTNYRVMYEDIYGTLVSGGGTSPNGKFYILDVAPNDMVTVSAAHDNYSILPTAFGHEAALTQADSVYQGLVKGPTVSGRVGIGGYIKNRANPQVGIKNVVVGQVDATSPVNATMSNTDGFFYLNLPQATPVQVKFEKPQDTSLAPTYSADMTFGAENLAIGDFNLFAKITLTEWTTTGKGIIRARVKDASGNYLAGAEVTVTSALHPETGIPYQICYDDACSTSKTETDATGRYVVKNVDPGDTVTVTAQKDGWTFNTRTFHTYADSMHQGSVTGTYTGVATPHPEAATIQDRFEAAMDLFNAGYFTKETGFAKYISGDFLDNGENEAMFLAEIQAEGPEQMTWVINSILGSGEMAIMHLTWGDGECDTLYFRKESDLWMLYGNQKMFDVWAPSSHQMYSSNSSPYSVSFSVHDTPLATITGVNVTGPGLPTGGIQLYHNTGEGKWYSWGDAVNPSQNPVWAEAPTGLPLNYTLTISYTGETGTSSAVDTVQIHSFVEAAPPQESLSPASGSIATLPLTFSWGSAGAGYHYEVELEDADYNRVWESENVTGTSVVYNGERLAAGTYYYNLITKDCYDNMSMIQVPFQMPEPPATVGVTGKAYNWAGTAPLNDAAVELWMGGTKQSTTKTDENGVFSFTGIPAGQTFYLKMSQTDLHNVYTGDINLGSTTGNVDLGIYNLPSDVELAPFGLQAEKGLIAGRVLDQQLGNGGRVAGAVVTATSASHPAPGYTVTYRDPLGNLGGTATYGNGRYYVLNVDNGDFVTVTATKGNRSPVSRTFHTFDGAVNEGSIRPAAPGYDISFAGTVSNASGSPVGGARVEIDGYPAIGVTTGTDGGYLLVNLPRDVNMNLKITRDGYVPSYTGSFSLGASMAGIPLTLFTQTDFTNMGVDSGKGLVAGRVLNNVLAPLTGAVVTVASNKGQTYTVNYGTGGGGATASDGGFWIPDVLAGDVVTITITHSGYLFPVVTYLQGYADAATTKLFIGSLLKGDINGDVKVDLADAILALQVMAGMTPSGVGVRDNYPLSGTDVNGDARIGQHELIYLLQYLAGLRTGASVPPVPSATPYTSDANTVLLDHFDGATGATILAYSENGASCGPAKPSATPKYSYGSGPNGLTQSLILNPPVGQPVGSGTYLQYPDGQLLSQTNGTIEFWTYLTSYGLSLVAQGPYPGSCAGWTFGMGVSTSGQLTASAWAAFNMNSGATLMPLNTWTHVAATWGSAGAKLYINGVLVGSDANTGMPASGYGGSVLMNYGAGSISTNIDELRISNIQRTTF